MAWTTPLANSWLHIPLGTAAHAHGAHVLAWIVCAGLIAFGPMLHLALRMRRMDRQIDRWADEEAPRPVAPTAAGHDTDEGP